MASNKPLSTTSSDSQLSKIPSGEAGVRREIYIAPLSRDITEEDLKKDFEELTGDIVETVRIRQRRGDIVLSVYAFISFRNPESIEEAIAKLDGRTFRGNKVTVVVARPTATPTNMGPIPLPAKVSPSSAMWNRCYECREEGHFARNCPLRLPDIRLGQHERSLSPPPRDYPAEVYQQRHYYDYSPPMRSGSPDTRRRAYLSSLPDMWDYPLWYRTDDNRRNVMEEDVSSWRIHDRDARRYPRRRSRSPEHISGAYERGGYGRFGDLNGGKSHGDEGW